MAPELRRVGVPGTESLGGPAAQRQRPGQGAAGAPWLGYALVGLVVNALALWVLLRRFRRVLTR